jgi:ATP-dependent protease ClpP protease subunit
MKKILNIFGDIASTTTENTDVTPSMVTDSISGLTQNDELEININCYGGEVFAAVAMRSLIASSPAKKIFNIFGVCASAATMLFDATDTVNIYNGAMVMYHKPENQISGNATEQRKNANLLDQIENENILKNLSIRTGKPENEMAALIENEWWISSTDAVNQLGFNLVGQSAIFNKAKTKQISVLNNYMEKKKALVNAHQIFINYKNSLRK